MTPRLSIVMPVLNPHPEYFPLAVTSLLEQSFDDFELVIVEDPPDPSPDPVGTEPLLDGIVDSRIRIVRNPQRTGLVHQLNQAVAESTAPYIGRMDADDIAHPSRFEKQLSFLETTKDIDVVGCQLRLISQDGETIGFRNYPTEHSGIVRAMRRYNPLPHPGVVIRRQALTEVGGYAEKGHAQDYDLWCRLASTGRKFANYDEVLLDYRIHLGATKAQQLRNTLRATLEVKRAHFGGTLDLRERARMLGERLALRAPPSLVLWLFQRFVVERNASSGQVSSSLSARP